MLLVLLTESTFPSPTCSSLLFSEIHSNRQITEFNFNKPSFTIKNWGGGWTRRERKTERDGDGGIGGGGGWTGQEGMEEGWRGREGK